MKDKRRISDFKANCEDVWNRETNPYYDNMHKMWICVILQAMADTRANIDLLPDSSAHGLCKITHLEAKYLFENEDFGRTRLRELCDLAATPLRAVLECYNNPNFNPEEKLRVVSNADRHRDKKQRPIDDVLW